MVAFRGRRKIAFAQLLLLIIIAHSSEGYLSYQSNIPNGNNVAHPCKANYLWKGVGHEQAGGGGVRNRFGEDFVNIGNRTWTTQLCNMDSDGDGMSNGEELGDPKCTWRVGQVPERTSNISHPGICNPFGTGRCVGQDTYVNCELEEFSCETTKRDAVRTIDITFPKTKVPNKDTSYYCMKAAVPTDGDYFLIAGEAILDNMNVMHHMVVYGCNNGQTEGWETPKECSMGSRDCSDIMAIWTVGLAGMCLPQDIGFRFGQFGYKTVLIEFHWNNPFLVDTYYDSSGMRLYFEPNRPGLIEAGVANVFQSDLVIPPGLRSVNKIGTCTSECSRRMLNAPIQIFDVLHHMHYLGKSQETTRLRDGVREVIAKDPVYSYDSPIVHRMEPSFEIRPGDEIQTVCEFSSISKNIWTSGGEATSDEMCVAFFLFYPASASNFINCGSFGQYDFCYAETEYPIIAGCNISSFYNFYTGEGKKVVDDLKINCNAGGNHCRPECAALVRKLKAHPCMKEDLWDLFNRAAEPNPMQTEVIARMSSCKQTQCEKERNSQEDLFSFGDVRDNSLALSSNTVLVLSVIVLVWLFALN